MAITSILVVGRGCDTENKVSEFPDAYVRRFGLEKVHERGNLKVTAGVGVEDRGTYSDSRTFDHNELNPRVENETPSNTSEWLSTRLKHAYTKGKRP